MYRARKEKGRGPLNRPIILCVANQIEVWKSIWSAAKGLCFVRVKLAVAVASPIQSCPRPQVDFVARDTTPAGRLVVRTICVKGQFYCSWGIFPDIVSLFWTNLVYWGYATIISVSGNGVGPKSTEVNIYYCTFGLEIDPWPSWWNEFVLC